MKRLYFIYLLLFVLSGHAIACTTAIISGKGTINGRPLLYKHRDTSALQIRQAKKYGEATILQALP